MQRINSLDTWLMQIGFEGWHGPLATTVRILLILAGTWIAQYLATRLIRTFRESITARMTGAEEVRRAETLGRIFRYVAAVGIGLIGGVVVLDEFGVSVAPILGAAGVVGIAVGFGAQNLVKDYFNGIFLLVENQIIKGDVVQIADKSGLVEDLTLRYVQLRDYDGNVHFVPNGLISTVTNMSRGFAYAVVDVGVAYREEIDDALAVMRTVAGELAADAAFVSRILAPFEVAGVERWDNSAVVLRGRFKVRPLEQWNVRREYLRRLKKAFDAAGIEIPFPHMTLYAGAGKDGRAPAFHVAGKQP
jgi:moderate conductance mechanosensitive channel